MQSNAVASRVLVDQQSMIVIVVDDAPTKEHLAPTTCPARQDVRRGDTHPLNSLSSPASLNSSGSISGVSWHHAFNDMKVAWKRTIPTTRGTANQFLLNIGGGDVENELSHVLKNRASQRVEWALLLLQRRSRSEDPLRLIHSS
jgi:hypothetical protein